VIITESRKEVLMAQIDQNKLRSATRELFGHLKKIRKGGEQEEKSLLGEIETSFGKLFSESQHVSFRYRPDVLRNSVDELIPRLERLNSLTATPENHDPIARSLESCRSLVKIIVGE